MELLASPVGVGERSASELALPWMKLARTRGERISVLWSHFPPAQRVFTVRKGSYSLDGRIPGTSGWNRRGLKRKNFEDNIRHIHLAVHAIEDRIKDFWWVQHGSLIEELMAKKTEEEGEL